MFIDTRQLEAGAVVATTVCIIGGGVAGITLAREMDKLGIDTCLLESGGFKPDDQTRDLCRGEAIGLPYRFADGCRGRFLGGSSNYWGGWNHPLDPWDFEQRDWIPYSGWPFGIDELKPFYRHAHKLLKLGPYNYDSAYWERAIGRPDVRRLPLSDNKVRDVIAQFSTPTPGTPARFGTLFREELKNSRNVRVFLYANAINIDTDSTAKTVLRVEVATLTGRKISVAAKRFVLATGGIENPRLLLASAKVQPEGLGNRNDLVGRFFMEHPRVLSATVGLDGAWSRNKFYDIKYHNLSPDVSAWGIQVAAKFALTPETLREERLLNARVWFSTMFVGEGTPAAGALFRCKQAVLNKGEPGWGLRRDLWTIVANPLDTMSFALARRGKFRSMVKEVKLQIIAEPDPDPQSRVTLSPTKTDQLGMPRVRVDWRLGDQVKRTFDRTLAIVADHLRQSGIARVTLDSPIEGREWPDSFEREGTWHHMGTTRMHDSPKKGVVDRNCRVHGISNLYIAGSSVFPTSGANLPTMTLVALALRLAEHIARALNSPGSSPTTAKTVEELV